MLERQLATHRVAGLTLTAALALALTSCTGPGSERTIAESVRPSTYAQFDVEFVDWAGRYVECARRFGAAAEVDLTHGAISSAYAVGRPTDQGLDAECVAEVGYPPKTPELTQSFLRGLYALLVEQAECLTKHGYAISSPPSRDEWVENYSGLSWNPLADVQKAGREVSEADAVCPQPEGREAELVGIGEK
mgnify:CR=1 FL=1